MNHVNKTFTKKRLNLSKDTFKKCVFNDCLLVFDATDAANLDECDLGDSKIGFDGCAGTTILFLSDIYKGGGAHIVKKIFDDIRKGVFIYGDAVNSKGVN